ncbi:WD repeat domain phosphoinositide-interacting protein 4-like [Symsagittifera roscoffensis]|uniref:WD repeat domain phosphoinositide-interacting protein 4-like n=1 Tax=Symsagittifera roscoffensis TaxID=84072 RepID=UPI00307C95C9
MSNFKIGSASALKFNKDFSCFACCTASGVQVFNTDPLQEKRKISELGTCSLVQMMGRSNFIAIVAGGKSPIFDDSTVALWDDAKSKIVTQLKFNEPVLNVKLKASLIVVVVPTRIHIFQFLPEIQKLASIETKENLAGICDMCLEPGKDLLLFPAHRVGSIQILSVSAAALLHVVSTAPVTIAAHKNPIAIISLDSAGNFVATASSKGTLVRVFDTAQRNLVAEFRRGADSAMLYSISFSLDSSYLCVSSDKGTVHVFAVKDILQNRRSNLRHVMPTGTSGGILAPYVTSQWALASFTTPAECPTAAAFSSHNTIVAICSDGSYFKYIFSVDGSGIINREMYDNFLQLALSSPENDF